MFPPKSTGVLASDFTRERHQNNTKWRLKDSQILAAPLGITEWGNKEQNMLQL